RAAERGYIRVIQCLMDHDDAFNIEDSDQEGRTALFWAVIANRIDTVQELLHLGANIEVQDLWRATSLCRACQYAHYEIAELLVHAGANVNAFNSHAWHPLHEVSARGNATMAKLLLDCGADPNCRNDRLYTPLNLAAQGRHPAVVRVLLESDRTEVNAANKDGWTALAEAGHHRQTEITRHLLEHGADANSRDSHDYTP
ncbi:ankyrin, partial [Viridothelium virens]